MNKKYTIRDIAKQAGVSVATVSYVINNRDDQRISEETKKKVLQIINLLDYKPNSSAKSLATNKTYNVALYLKEEESIYKRSEQLHIAQVLAQVLKMHGYRLLLQHCEDLCHIDYADAILCYDVDEEYFHSIGDKNLIPLLAIDSLIDIPWFFQICTDYSAVKKAADEHFGAGTYTFACTEPNCLAVKALIQASFAEVCFIQNASDSEKLSGRNIVYRSKALQPLFSGLPSLLLPCNTRAKMEKVFECMGWAVSRLPDSEHIFYV